jgi:hypothetical protein
MPACPPPEFVYERRQASTIAQGAFTEADPNWKMWKKQSQRFWTTWNPSIPDPSTFIGTNYTHRTENREQIQIEEVERFFHTTSTGDATLGSGFKTYCEGGGTSSITFLKLASCSGTPTWLTEATDNGTFTFVGGMPDPADPPNNYPPCRFRVDRTAVSYSGVTCSSAGTGTTTNTTTFTSFIHFIAPGSGNSGVDDFIYTTSITAPDWIAEASTILDDRLSLSENWISGIGAGCSLAQTFPVDGTISPTPSMTKIKIRYRIRIPISHTGNYFKITYDVAEFPEDEDVDPSFVSEDNVIEWTGPGDQGDSEDESWFTDWIEMLPPTIPGQRRIVNIRYTCYQGTTYGVKPQVTGEAFTPPAP